jgi:hypothetical protein
VAASLAFVVLAGYLLIIMLDRETTDEPVSTVHAASPPSHEQGAPALAENQDFSGLRIRLEGSSPVLFTAVITVTVAPDANLDYLSRKYLGSRLNQQTLNEILLLNPQITDPDKLRSGSLIRLPLTESGINVSTAPPKESTANEQSPQETAPGK